jgi:nucleoside-diphosphate-sugar epimerase
VSKPWLIFGLSGPVAQPLYQRLLFENLYAIAIRRSPITEHDVIKQSKLQWLRGSLQNAPELPDQVAGVVSMGPLDAFTEWMIHSSIQTPRVIALGSASEIFKANSNNAHDRAIAAVLRSSRERLIECMQRKNIDVCVLRPTLIHGTNGGDSLSRAANVARRYRIAPIPNPANGLRQPLHCEDLCDAVWQLMQATKLPSATIDLPGPTAVTFARMLELNFQRHAPNAWRIKAPAWVRPLIRPLLPFSWRSALDRLDSDQIMPTPANLPGFSWAPRHHYG